MRLRTLAAVALALTIVLQNLSLASTPSQTAQISTKIGADWDSNAAQNLGSTQNLYTQMQLLGWNSILFQLGDIKIDNHPSLSLETRADVDFIKQSAAGSPNSNWEFWYGVTPGYGWNNSKWWDLVDLIGNEFGAYSNIKIAYAYVYELYGKTCQPVRCPQPGEPGGPTAKEEAAAFDKWVTTAAKYGKGAAFRNPPLLSESFTYATRTWNIGTSFRSMLDFRSNTPLPSDEPQLTDNSAATTWAYYRKTVKEGFHVTSGQYGQGQSASMRYSTVKEILLGEIAVSPQTFHFTSLVHGDSTISILTRKGLIRAHREVLFNEYVNPVTGGIFSTDAARIADWKATGAYLTLSIQPYRPTSNSYVWGSQSSIDVTWGVPFDVIATVQNQGVAGGSFEILFMIDSFALTSADNLRIPFTMNPGETKTFSWRINSPSTPISSGVNYIAVLILGGTSSANPFGKLYDWEWNDLWRSQEFNPSSGTATTTTTSTTTPTTTTSTTTTLPQATTTTSSTTTTLSSAPFDFSMDIDPQFLLVTQGQSVSSRLTLSVLRGNPEFVLVSALGLPDGVGISFNPVSGILPFTSQISITTSRETSAGTYELTIAGNSSNSVRTAKLFLTINRFSPTYYLTIRTFPAEGGTTTPAPGIYNYSENSEITIFAIPASGWTLDHWTIDGRISGNGTLIRAILTSNLTFDAFFVKATLSETPTHTVSLLVIGPASAAVTIDGKEYVLPASFQWIHGSNHTITADQVILESENIRYLFAGWRGYSLSTAAEITLTVDHPYDLAINYVKQYLITITFSDASARSLEPSSFTILDEKGNKLRLEANQAWVEAGSRLRVTSATWMNVFVIGQELSLIADSPTSFSVPLLVFDETVRVVDIFGRPIPGVTVQITAIGGATLTQETDEHGIAHFPSLPLGPFTGSATFLGVSTPFSSDRLGSNEITIVATLNYPLLVIGLLAAAILATRLVGRMLKDRLKQSSRRLKDTQLIRYAIRASK